MKSIRNVLKATLLTAGAVLTAATSLSLATAADEAATTSQTPPPGPHGWHHHGPMHLLSQLGLSATQKQQVKDIMTAAHPEMQSLHEQMHTNALKLRQTLPTDANYATIEAQVSQTHGSLAAQMMTQQSEVRAKVFKILTPAQQTQLTALEAQMQAKHGARGGPRGPSPDVGAPPAE
jgi:Spy/CpxP family protein refolding chaperone